ncbi:tRNA 5-methoxyuridine(34)/uridine 5-oxyacetic acid(34) synthase CmoB [bacterium (Candidatus Blackallbacteria) CG17_big_fil_post_rev_8_21_14_2_50_48_46]|uniref:tRNA 5-methoxyuridine(34)/uridine 5-oxyacetic acid(34) synthase CmoB n=1 Tax=bacterium (Candidatus Blackallbacteria) CG17_big_fil_post_rev_8_21_14_2_50_48_46 TaxID=2014261 RepID=A0A2M7GC74_9BACT|nr:MAG: tRNA 5-methoxyuridine(34)/uridine 5-oxyacetic acid(34) synthase CmoB [bacterium (Candidatus Blackallbacteria) CG18_big_fil_WC_8_21_14_2_50_49_26]PIW19543.1 MAG: tRNA 5-methoxyuridine(34)/uridine 5-oxyacetic acid(34) synthase CmoB [bacterium (Candidatus Blackallbacteria) CG17_big_fil_post_rev_8_21_14_2_50_48_46]PIW48854.1 MAG: tRNA 5-methoxyuridine(34)/uridine 5-oxyacetic acid(34) synthase CmoB [bacterium (Candidatus Blackallbacteria) CG13_big_fil_rev_8_21_14_2_50_49_14]
MFRPFYSTLSQGSLAPWLESLPARLARWEREEVSQRDRNWLQLIPSLPHIQPSEIDLQNTVRIGQASDLAPGQEQQLYQLLQRLKPWRKGPFELFDLKIETEWRSDWKWERLLPHIAPLKGKNVLDIGCGNGYHLWRIRGAGAETVIGIDPSPLFLAQFQVFQHFHPDPQVHLLPLGVDDLPAKPLFDTVFSMGVLYHRRSPIDFLNQLKAQLRPGGQLVLETLVIEGDAQTVLVPEERYAKMRNVWFIPSTEMLLLWLRRTGFKNPRLVNLNRTSLQEQQRTDWMDWESLEDFLNPTDSNRTVEGYPAPLRATLVAEV